MELEILEGLAWGDRAAAMAQLLPGSEDHDYYLGVHAQHRGDLDAAQRILDAWPGRHGRTAHYQRLHNRQLVYRATSDHPDALEELRDALGANHWHEAAVEDTAPARPTRVPNDALDPARLLSDAVARDRHLSQVTDEGIAELLHTSLPAAQRRVVLGRVRHTPSPVLVEAIAADLAERDAPGFGSLGAHHALTLDQLHAVARLHAPLLSNRAWQTGVARRMRPPSDVDLAHDLEARARYLADLAGFVLALPPAANSFKAHVLWHLLDTDLRRNAPVDRERVRDYLALPRNVHYQPRKLVEKVQRDDMAELADNFRDATGLPPAIDDEALIVALIQRDLAAAESYAPWIQRAWLDAQIATAVLLTGAPNADAATRKLGPSAAAALRDRIELAWCPHNPTRLAADAEVVLEADVKHVDNLVVKVFRIDPIAYFQHHHREVDATIDLDGLAASHGTTIAIAAPPVRRVRQRLALPACARPGTYVVDLIGNGMASRAILRKGRLRHALRITAAGHELTIFDDAGAPRPDAEAWIGDRAHAPDARGAIVVPFSTQPGRTAVLLTAGDIACVTHIELVRELPALALSLELDQQALSAGRTATAIARLALTISGAPASLRLLDDPTWEVSLTDRSGVTTTKALPLALDAADAAELSWPLGDDPAAIAITVRGRVAVRSTQRDEALAASARTQIATLYAGPATEALYLARTRTGWVLSALGKSGEPRAHRPVSIALVHRWTELAATGDFATDAHGRVELGLLRGARSIEATLGAHTQRWDVDHGPRRDPGDAPPIHAMLGEPVVIHLPASRSARDALARLSLVELRGNAPARHVAPDIEALDGALVLRGLPAGEYELCWPGAPRHAISVTGARTTIAGWAVARDELLELPRVAPAIASLTVEGDQLAIQLRGGDAATRVHVIATRFVPAPTAPSHDGPRRAPQRLRDPAPGATYVSGRELGDEIRYVLERRSAKRFPGTLLERPSLLLNPWARRATNTERSVARPGAPFAQAAPMMAAMAPAPAEESSTYGARASDDEAGYDFLPAPPAVLANLVADANGLVTVPVAALGDATTATVIVDDPAGTTRRWRTLPERPLAPRDLRLRRAIDPERHVAQQRAIVPLVAGERLELAEPATAQLHLIDSVERAHGYLLSLRDEPALRELAFVTRWHTLGDAERRELYGKHACHELHLFLYFKDRAFFDAVIRPYLGHKRTKTFIDRWLLDDDLAAFLAPDRLARLNAFERALLAQRVVADDALARVLDGEVAILPADPERDRRLIDAVLGAATLEGSDHTVAYDSDESFSAVADSAASFGAPVVGGMAMPAAPPPPAPKAAKRMAAAAKTSRGGGGYVDDLAQSLERRKELAPRFRAADKTQEWAEHNWWHRGPDASGPEMIAANRLWRDLAHHRGGGFLSRWLGLATQSFAEAMCALAVIDLPFASPSHAFAATDSHLAVTAAGNALAGTSQLVDGPLVTDGPPLVVGMSYVRADDRYHYVDGEHVDKYVDGPFATGVVYTCLIVLANPSSSRQRLSALVQIPRGSIAVSGARATQTIDVALAPYGTHGHELSFYFPVAGAWSHFPVHVRRGDHIVAAAPPRTLRVEAGAQVSDPQSWPHVAQRGTVEDVVAYLATANLAAIDLELAAWRLRQPDAYRAILDALEARRSFAPTLWAYALLHRDAPRIRTWLRARASQLDAGPVLAPLGLDAEDLGRYEHLELAPLINARAHRLGAKHRILNDGLAAQYRRHLELVAHRAAPSSDDLLAAAHYLLAQDRVPDALAALARVDRTQIADQLQHDYLAGYAATLTGELGHARAIVERWHPHPVPRWRSRFAQLAALLDDQAPAAVDPHSRDLQQAKLAAEQPAFDIALDDAGVAVASERVDQLELRFFEMDVELLFSRQPFVASDVARFSFIEPSHREILTAPSAQRVAWPAALRGKNVVVEAVGAGARKTKVHYANDLATQVAHQYGQLRARRASDGSALAATYVKVYARATDGQVAFYKDGYTDLRGWFDYATLSTDELDRVERFAILVCSDRAGAAIVEAAPPAR